MKIMYACKYSPTDSSVYRMHALERLGHHISLFDSYRYEPTNVLLQKMILRLAAGPWIDRLNRELLEMARHEQPELLWADKQLWIRPQTLKHLRRMRILTVSYMIDNPFGSRRDPGWRLYLKDIPEYDLHVVQRDRNISEYKKRGARDTIKIQTAYEQTIHFPPPVGWSDRNRDREVSFIGTPYDNRAEFLTRLWRDFQIPIAISGGRIWKSALGAHASQAMYRGNGELFGKQYREGIWRSKINLSFITHSNCDEFAHKSFEIAGCSGFLLAERSDGHALRFVENEEAVFFSSIEECVAKIQQYLPDQSARDRIAAAGRRRAVRDGYHNDHQLSLILDRAQKLLERI